MSDVPSPNRQRFSGVGGLLVVAALVAACSGSAKSLGVATLGSTSQTTVLRAAPAGSGDSGQGAASSTFEQQALRHAQCMRAHGITNFPDPVPGKSESIGQSGVDTNSPTYQAASSACRQYEPKSGNPGQGATSQDRTQQLNFAKCMRKHGIPNFPDPSSRGGPQSVTNYGIDPNSPTFQAANRACSSLLAGGGG
jgi:hypothetical protein